MTRKQVSAPADGLKMAQSDEAGMRELGEFQDCARRLKALADPERLRIISILFQGEKNVSELSEALNDEIVKVSHHLGVLRNSGLVTANKQGRFVVYALHPDVAAATKAGSGSHIDLGCCRLDLEPNRSRSGRSRSTA